MTKTVPSTKYPMQISEFSNWPWFGDKEKFRIQMPDGRPWPRICVVMPSYNHVQFLEASICSILSQGYPNLEYIIMDGGSTDGSVEVIKKYEPWLSYWRSATDNGQYSAIQEGFERSNSEVMTWLNSDDLLFPWTLFTIGKIFANLPDIQWLSSSIGAMTDETNDNIGFWYRRGMNYRWFFENRPLSQKGFIQQEGTFWSRNLWEKAGARFDGSLQYAGDLELWARFWQYADLATVATPLGIFRQHDGQKSSQTNLYFEEARRIFSCYPSFLRIPTRLLRVLVKFLPYFESNKMWGYFKCSHPVYDFPKKKWLLEKRYEV
jgi:glycosyltransferase involved in cell wall biosynthesis